MSKQQKTNKQAGFTIIELLIATSILSTMLVMVTTMMIGISNLYYKGINQSRVQDAVRGVTEEVGHALQLTDKTPLSEASPISFSINGSTLAIKAYCIDTTRYSYIIGVQIGSGSNRISHVLWRDDIAATANCLPVNLQLSNPESGPNAGTNGTELATPNSRLNKFTIGLISPYNISVGMVYGDDDLLCSPSVVGSCASSTVMSPQAQYTLGDLRCRGKTGDQFCSVSNLTTTVVQRLN